MRQGKAFPGAPQSPIGLAPRGEPLTSVGTIAPGRPLPEPGRDG